jgi:integrase
MITKAIIFDHRGRTAHDKEGPIELRFIIDRKPLYVNTGIKVLSTQLRDGTIINRPDMDVLNDRLATVTLRIEKAINRCIASGIPIDVAELRRAAYSPDNDMPADMMEWFRNQVPLLKISENTRKHCHTLIRRLDDFGKFRAWSDLTLERLFEFDTWLHQREKQQTAADKQLQKQAEKVSTAAVYNYHKRLKALINRAVKFGIIPANPYDRLRGEFERGDNRDTIDYLTDEEVEAFEALHPLPGSQLATARDLFVFQLYTGLSYADAQAFQLSDYKLIDGTWQHVGKRIKTGVPYVNQLLPPVVDILKRYNNQPPRIILKDYNQALKTLGIVAGITTRLHSHMARHTFATRMLRWGVKIENVSKMLGHTNITQTQRYAKVVAESVHEDFARIAEQLTKKGTPK